MRGDFRKGSLGFLVNLIRKPATEPYNFVAEYIKGQKNVLADYLSRDALTRTLPKNEHKQHRKTEDIVTDYTHHVASESVCNKEIAFLQAMEPISGSITAERPPDAPVFGAAPEPTICVLEREPVVHDILAIKKHIMDE